MKVFVNGHISQVNIKNWLLRFQLQLIQICPKRMWFKQKMHQFRVKMLEALLKERYCLHLHLFLGQVPSVFAWVEEQLWAAFPGATGKNQWLTTKQRTWEFSPTEEVGQTVSLQPMNKLDYASCSRVRHRPQESIDTVKTVVLET